MSSGMTQSLTYLAEESRKRDIVIRNVLMLLGKVDHVTNKQAHQGIDSRGKMLNQIREELEVLRK